MTILKNQKIILLFFVGLFVANHTILAQQPHNAFIARGDIWEAGRITVCWENPTQENRRMREHVRRSIQDTWEKHSLIRFTGWGQCASNSQGIRILIADEHPRVKAFGTQLNGRRNGMVLNFDWNCPDDSDTYRCNRGVAVHEFGHALGFVHEQTAPGCACEGEAQAGPGYWHITPCDERSVMNYCNPAYNNNGYLSDYDQKAVRTIYGTPEGVPDGIGIFRSSGNQRNWYFDFDMDGKTDKNLSWARPGDIPITGDFNGDGRADIAVFRTAGNRRDWYFDFGANGSEDKRISWGRPGDIPIAADFNGDGQTDIAIFRTTNAARAWYFDYNLDGRTDNDIPSWGRPGDIPIAGDFNGDGRGDIAVFRSSGNQRNWYFDFSANGSEDKRISWGRPSDIPIAGDFNGDGRTDIAIFRTTNAARAWYFDYNLDGHTDNNISSWGRPGDIPISIK